MIIQTRMISYYNLLLKHGLKEPDVDRVIIEDGQLIILMKNGDQYQEQTRKERLT